MNDDLDDLSQLQRVAILLVNAKNNSPIKGSTWYQKELFLIAKNLPSIEQEASFEPDFFGPFSEPAEEEIENLEQEEIIARVGQKIVLTSDGKELANEIKKTMPRENLAIIEDFKELLNDLTEDELLAFIYFSFPETTSESRILQRIIHGRKVNAISLYNKGKVSLEKGAEIAGLDILAFTKLVSKK